MAKIHFRHLTLADISHVFELESKCFPIDEAATYENIKYRITNAADLQIGMFLDDSNLLIGQCLATLSTLSELDHSSMSLHSPSGSLVCLHSICIDPRYQRKGLGLLLIKHWISAILTNMVGKEKLKADHKGVDGKKIRLITHENLIEFYRKAGFKFIRESPIKHGHEKWHEMEFVSGQDLGQSQLR